MKLFLALALLSIPAFAVEPLPDNFCDSPAPPSTPPPAAPCTPAMVALLKTNCDSLVTQVKDVEHHVVSTKAECNRVSTVATRKSGRAGNGDQNLAPGDTAAMTSQNSGYMRQCAREMGRYRDAYKALSTSADRGKQNAGECASVKAGYEKMKSESEPRKTEAQALVDQYSHGASAADLVTSANKKNAAGLGTAGDPAAAKQTGEAEKKQAAGGGGGGMPQIPQIPQMPQQKPDPNAKTAAQIIAEQKAARQTECHGLIKTYSNGVVNCDSLHRCQPEIVRVVDVCTLYNSCIAALASVPSDCSGAPTPALPK